MKEISYPLSVRFSFFSAFFNELTADLILLVKSLTSSVSSKIVGSTVILVGKDSNHHEKRE